jgi:hypothetical protein
MFVAERLIYLELLKTGCTHIKQLLRAAIPGENVGKHNRLPDNFLQENKAIIGSIRNPWDWYISLWAFGCDGKGIHYRRLTKHNVKGYGVVGQFAPVSPVQLLLVALGQLRKPVRSWRRVYSNSHDPKLFQEWLKMVLEPGTKYTLGDGYGFSSVSSFAGLLTYYYLQLFSRNSADLYSHQIRDFDALHQFDQTHNILKAVIRTENLEDDLIKILQEIGYELNQEQLHQIQKPDRTNTSSRVRDISYYYNQETLDLVAEKERLIIQKYNYAVPVLAVH